MTLPVPATKAIIDRRSSFDLMSAFHVAWRSAARRTRRVMVGDRMGSRAEGLLQLRDGSYPSGGHRRIWKIRRSDCVFATRLGKYQGRRAAARFPMSCRYLTVTPSTASAAPEQWDAMFAWGAFEPCPRRPPCDAADDRGVSRHFRQSRGTDLSPAGDPATMLSGSVPGTADRGVRVVHRVYAPARAKLAAGSRTGSPRTICRPDRGPADQGFWPRAEISAP